MSGMHPSKPQIHRGPVNASASMTSPTAIRSILTLFDWFHCMVPCSLALVIRWPTGLDHEEVPAAAIAKAVPTGTGPRVALFPSLPHQTSSWFALAGSRISTMARGEDMKIRPVVVAVGAGKVQEGGQVRKMDIKAGDRVLFTKHAGNEIEIDGSEHLILREDDVLALVE
jgi:co-chaperonin GroES (HSP10)